MTDQQPIPPQFAAPAGVMAPPKKKKKWPWIVGAIILVFVIAGVATGGGDKENTPAAPAAANVAEAPAQNAAAPEAPAAPAPAPKKAATRDPLTHDGTYLVGSEIQPGEYRVEVAKGAFGDTGFWSRCADKSCSLTGSGGTLGAVIENGIVNGPGFLTIEPTDTAVKLQSLVLTPM